MRRLLAFLLVLAWPAIASADDDAARAEALFESGKAALSAGRVEAACSDLAESLRLQKGVGVALWAADCYERQGKLASAWSTFEQAITLARARSDNREGIATERARKLQARLYRVAVTSEDPNATIERDGIAMPANEIGVPIPLDPGQHRFVATSPAGRTQIVVDASVEGKTERITIPKPASTLKVTATPEKRQRTTPILGLAVAGAGAVALGASGFFALSARSAYDDSNATCAGNVCDQAGLAHRDDAFDRAAVSTVTFAVGAVALVAGAVLFFVARSGS
jgi:hypothetical protein